MKPEDVIARLLNPTLVGTMIAAGIAYGALLWSFRIHPVLRLWAIATLPGIVFLVVIWSVRGFQGVMSAVYLALLIDWLVFSQAGTMAVIGWRRWRHGRTR